jgi:D-lactate dehydrogenase
VLGAMTGGALPRWEPALARIAARRDGGGRRRANANANDEVATDPAAPRVTYFPSCVARVLQPTDEHGVGVDEALRRVAARAGVLVRTLDDPRGLCCGMPFGSKGLHRAAQRAAERTLRALAGAGRGEDGAAGTIVTDASPCAMTLKERVAAWARAGGPRLEVLDGIELAHDLLLPRLDPRPLDAQVALHPVCSVHRMGLVERLEALARRCARDVTTPLAAGCCGFAGDRGFSHPALTAAALAAQAAESGAPPKVPGYSSSPTCEIGLTRARGRTYRSFWHLLDAATARAREGGAGS